MRSSTGDASALLFSVGRCVFCHSAVNFVIPPKALNLALRYIYESCCMKFGSCVIILVYIRHGVIFSVTHLH